MRHYLTLRQAAALSGLSPRHIYELCRSGMVRARVMRGRWWVHRGEFAAWIAPKSQNRDRWSLEDDIL